MDTASLCAAVRCLPRWFHCRDRRPVELRILSTDEGPKLAAMYLAYQPRNSFQGLPPLKDEACARWVHEMIASGINMAACTAEERLIGHLGLFPINAKKCELLVVVAPGDQNLGIGTHLVRGAIDVAAELGFERIWLPVEAANMRARHVYQKCEFQYVGQMQTRELDMVCELATAASHPKMSATEPGHKLPPPYFALAKRASSGQPTE